MTPWNAFSAALVSASACFMPVSFAQDNIPDVQKIHRNAIVIDTYTDTPMKLVNGQFDSVSVNRNGDAAGYR